MRFCLGIINFSCLFWSTRFFSCSFFEMGMLVFSWIFGLLVDWSLILWFFVGSVLIGNFYSGVLFRVLSCCCSDSDFVSRKSSCFNVRFLRFWCVLRLVLPEGGDELRRNRRVLQDIGNRPITRLSLSLSLSPLSLSLSLSLSSTNTQPIN